MLRQTPTGISIMQTAKTLTGLSVADRLASNGALSVDDVAAWTGVGRGTVYQEIRDGRLKIAKVGRRTIVRAADARAWLASMTSGPAYPITGSRP
jgi:excisionase family DNA binding protein